MNMYKTGMSMSRNNGTTLGELLIFIILFFVIVGALNIVGYMTYNMTYSDGIKYGSLMKVTTKGFIFKTKEVDINLGGLKRDSEGHMTPNIESYTVVEDSIYNQLQSKMDNGQPVTIDYREVLHMPFWIGTGDRIIVKVH